MRCPFCSNKETRVVETRETEEGVTRRRRECLSCRKRFTTYENTENFNLRIIKKDGNREFFDKVKDKAKKAKKAKKQKKPKKK